MRQKKYLTGQLDKVSGAQIMLDETVMAIESAQMDVEVFQAMKQGDQVLTDLRKQVTVDEFEELYDNVKDAEENLDREREIFGEVLDKDALMDELNALDVDDIGDLQGISVGSGAIKQNVQLPD